MRVYERKKESKNIAGICSSLKNPAVACKDGHVLLFSAPFIDRSLCNFHAMDFHHKSFLSVLLLLLLLDYSHSFCHVLACVQRLI